MTDKLLTRIAGSGFLSANIAIALFGLSGVVGKATGLSAPLIVFGRSAFGAVALVAAMHFMKASIVVSRRQLIPLVMQGVVLAAHWVTFFQAINVGGVAIGLLSFSTFPFFVALLEPLVIKQRPTRAELAGSAAIIVGVYSTVARFGGMAVKSRSIGVKKGSSSVSRSFSVCRSLELDSGRACCDCVY